MPETVAALYVETGGVYFGVPGVDPWDEKRDARRYAGPYPVVAHPPCARWSIMGLCRPEFERGDDGGCFECALAAVRTYGGVLEHPRHTLAWKRFGLPRPAAAGWTRDLFDPGWTCEVDQRRYGHPARKPTWLYYVGPEPPQLDWGPGRPGERIFMGRYGPRTTGRVTTDNNHSRRSRSPRPFRDLLIELARLGSPALGVADLADERAVLEIVNADAEEEIVAAAAGAGDRDRFHAAHSSGGGDRRPHPHGSL